MVSNWQMDPVGVKGCGRIPKHAANVEGVVLARIEISVVADKHWHQQLLFASFENSLS